MSDATAEMVWAQELLEEDNFCILDTETTGLGESDQICQIAVIDSRGETVLNELVKPTCPISSGASKVHGLTADKLINAASFDALLTPLLKAVGRRDVVIYNAEYDLRLIRQSLKPWGIQLAFPTSDRRKCRIFPNGGSIHCAMLWYSQYVGEWNDRHQDYRWQKLPGGDHSALGDCLATLALIQKMAKGE